MTHQPAKRFTSARTIRQTGVRRSMFRLFDKDGTGDVDVQEFRGVIFALGIKLTENETCALFGRSHYCH